MPSEKKLSGQMFRTRCALFFFKKKKMTQPGEDVTLRKEEYEFEFDFIDKRTGIKFEHVKPVRVITLDGKRQSLIVREMAPPCVLASISIERPIEDLWRSAQEMILERISIQNS